MTNFNMFYVTVITTGLFLFLVLRPDFHQELSFYGFAESRATEINYNYPVVVDRILVKPGQMVEAGEVLLHLSRRKSKEFLADQDFRIAELKAKAALWEQKLKNQIEELTIDQQTRLAEIEGKIQRTEKELAYKKSLVQDLQSIQPEQPTYSPLAELLEKYEREKVDLKLLYDSRITGLKEEVSLGRSPYHEQIKRYLAEKDFDESQKVQPIVVRAPTKGLVGTVSCKEEEHIPSYSTLLTFYEPHSGLIKGYVHEDLTLEVKLGQAFTISSLKDEQVQYPGTVIGLGSRIVEIPSRLRKIETVKAYGREVLIEVCKDNSFLQKEKVGITYGVENNTDNP